MTQVFGYLVCFGLVGLLVLTFYGRPGENQDLIALTAAVERLQHSVDNHEHIDNIEGVWVTDAAAFCAERAEAMRDEYEDPGLDYPPLPLNENTALAGRQPARAFTPNQRLLSLDCDREFEWFDIARLGKGANPSLFTACLDDIAIAVLPYCPAAWAHFLRRFPGGLSGGKNPRVACIA